MPKSKLGKWSIGLIVTMPALFFLAQQFMHWFYEGVSSGDTILDDVVNRPFLAVTMLVGMASGASAFFTGIIAILKQKDKGFLVYISTVLGALTIIYLTMEMAFPH